VLSRGNERKSIFRDNRDRLMFLDVIGEMADQYGVDIFAYTLMDNHHHSAMRTKIKKESDLRAKYNNIYSLCKM